MIIDVKDMKAPKIELQIGDVNDDGRSGFCYSAQKY